MSENKQSSILKNTGLMVIATLCSRVTGLVRTWAMAFALGNTFITSAYNVANNLPNVIYELVAGGLLAAAFIPIYLLQKEKLGTKGGNDFANNILNILLVVLGILSILAIVFAKQVVATQTFTVDSDSNVSVYAVYFFQIFAVQIVFYGLGGVVTGILNANRSYFVSNLAPALNNVCVIIGMFAYIPWSQQDPESAITMLAIMTTLGVAIQFGVQIPLLRKVGFKYRFHINLKDPALIDALKIAAPTLLYILGTFVSFSARNAFSLETGDLGPSMLGYAWIWYQLPYGVVAVSLSRALFTEMSEAAAKDDMEGMRNYTEKGIRATLFLVIPLAGLIGVLAQPILGIFKSGAFNQQDVQTIAIVLQVWVVSLPFYAVMMYLYNAFASIRKFLVFALTSCLLVIVQVGLYATLCKTPLGILGVPVADLFYYGLGAIILLAIIQRRVGSMHLGAMLSLVVKTLVATAIGCLIAWGILYALGFVFTSTNILISLVQIIIAGGLGLAAFIATSVVIKIPESEIVSNLLSRFKRG